MKIIQRMHRGKLVPANEEERKKIESFTEGAFYETDIKIMDTRTQLQNSSIHLWCQKIADTLNKEKLFIQDVIKINTKWSMIKVKEMLFKPVVKSLYTKDSTTKLNKDEFGLIIDTLVRYMAQKGCVLPEFPNREQLEEITNKKGK